MRTGATRCRPTIGAASRPGAERRAAGAARPVWQSFGELAEGSNYAEAEAMECSGQVSPIVRGNSLGGVG
jgi:hypothetical protein